MKIDLFNALVLSNGLYGCATWNTKQKDIDHLDSFQYRALKKILQISWQDLVSYQELLDIATKLGCTVVPMECKIRESRLKYLGHVERMDNFRLPKIVLHGDPECGKRVRRVETNFRSCVFKDMLVYGMDVNRWQCVAGNRTNWRKSIIEGRQVCIDRWNERRARKRIQRHLNDEIHDRVHYKMRDSFRVALLQRLDRIEKLQIMDDRMSEAFKSEHVNIRRRKKVQVILKYRSRVTRLLNEYRCVK